MFNNVALQATAGSGKTRALAKRFLELYLRLGDYNLPCLCAITFTNKATLEMKERVLRYIDLLADFRPAEKDEEKEIIQFFKEKFSTINLQQLAREKREVLLNNLSDLQISTFDSLFFNFLSAIPFQAKILPGFKVIEEIEESVLLEETFDEFFEEALHNPEVERTVRQLLRPEEKDVKKQMKKVFEPFRTHLLEIRNVFLEPETLLKDWTQRRDKIIGDIKRRLPLFIALVKNNAQYQTKQGKANARIEKKMEKIKEVIGGERLEEIAGDFVDGKILKKQDFNRFLQNLDNSARNDVSLSIRQEIDTLQKEFQNYIKTTSNTILLGYLIPMQQIYERFQNKKREQNSLTYDDLELLTLEALKKSEEREYLYFKLSGRVNHLFIDEFQDTSIQEYKILQPIINEVTSGAGSLFYVGDPNQAIFRWRKGEARLFQQVMKEFPGKIEREELDKNYRGKKEIVEFVNALFKEIENYHPMIPMLPEGGWVRIADLGEYQKEEGEEEIGKRVVQIIKQLHHRGYKYCDLTILVRRNETGVRLADRLSREKIPCVSESRAKLLVRGEIKTILNLLQFLEDPEDDFSLAQVLLSPIFQLSEKEIFNIKKGKSLYLTLRDEHPEWECTKKLTNLLNLVGFLNPYEFLFTIYMQLGMEEIYGCSEVILSLLEATLKYCQEHGYTPLSSFVDWLKTFGRAIEVREKQPEGVNISTVHKAKGLQFKVVILPETQWQERFEDERFLFEYEDDEILPGHVYWRKELKGIFLDLHEKEKERLKKDELNLLYVALTRAQEGLWILGYHNPRVKNFTWFSFIKENAGGEYSTGQIGQIKLPPEKKVKEELEPIFRPLVEPFGEEQYSVVSATGRRVGVPSEYRREEIKWGNICHYALSKVEWLDGEDIGKVVGEIVNCTERALARTEREAMEIRQRLPELLRATLPAPRCRSIFFKDNRQLTVKTEVPIYFQKDRKDISGRIDRLLVGDDFVSIVDFKTGKEKEEDKKQMSLYVQAVGKIYPGRRVESDLIYVESL